MNITFVAIGSEQLAISLLSSIAKNEGHNTNVAYSSRIFEGHGNWLSKMFDDSDDVMKQIIEQQPDVLAFSVITMNYQPMLEFARKTKALFPHVKTVFGGVHISAEPDRAIARDEVDYVVVGEGEKAFVEILKAIENGGSVEPIENTRFKNEEGEVIKGKQVGFYQDLDSFPPYDKTIWEDHVDISSRYLTMVSRGCPYRCSFCFNNFFAKLPEENKGKYVRLRSVDHVMNELTYAKKRYKIKWVEFEDDVFTVYKPWIKEFLVRYKNEIGVPFKCLSHPHYLDEEIIILLKEAGCKWLQMGIQSMDEEFKYQTLMRYEKSSKIEEVLSLANKHKFNILVDHMFGLPGEPIEAQAKALELYKNYSPAKIQTFWTCFLPGTDVMKQGLAEGIITEEQAEVINEGKGFFFYRVAENIKDKELVRFYGAHEILFRLMPNIPKFLRKRIKPEHIMWMPYGLIRPFVILFEISEGLLRGYPHYRFLFGTYIVAIKSLIRRKLKLKKVQPGKIYDFGPQKHVIGVSPQKKKMDKTYSINS